MLTADKIFYTDECGDEPQQGLNKTKLPPYIKLLIMILSKMEVSLQQLNAQTSYLYKTKNNKPPSSITDMKRHIYSSMYKLVISLQ